MYHRCSAFALGFVWATILAQAQSLTTIRVNAGGPAYTDAAGNVWQADSGFSGGFVYSTSQRIANTTSSALYQTQHAQNGGLTYSTAVPNGSYSVKLSFAELYLQ